MLSLLKTVLTIGVLFVQLSSSAALKRHGGWPTHSQWKCHGPWCPKHSTKSHSVATFTAASTLIAGTTTFAPTYTPYPSDSTSDIEDTETASPTSTDSGDNEPVETSAPSSDGSGDDEPVATTAHASSYSQPAVTSTAAGTAVPATTLVTATVIPQPATSAGSTKAGSTATATGPFWKPSAGATWQIELSGVASDLSLGVSIFDLDLFDVPATTISTLHSAGKKVICYFSAGSFESWRSDASSFTAADKGSAMEGWEGEWWLNTNSANVRKIMTTRIEMAKTKGCDGIDPDNVDGYANANGVGLTEADAIDYLSFLSTTAHANGLSIGLKNAGGLVGKVLDMMEFHVNEQCLQFNECSLFQPFIEAGKPVFHIEYPDAAPNITPDVKSQTCGVASTSGFSTVLKTLELNAWREAC
jgi:hypothetical protein